MIEAFVSTPTSTKTSVLTFLGCCSSDIFGSLHDSNLYQALDVHPGFDNLDIFSIRVLEAKKERKKRLRKKKSSECLPCCFKHMF